MKLHYITTPEHAKELVHDWHGIDLGNGKVLVCIRWKDEIHEAHWSDHPDVIALPHPIFASTVHLGDQHLQHLQGKFPVNKGDNIHDLLKHVAKDDPWMKVHVL